MTNYHVIPHSHWDREWYLSFDEFRGMLVNMIDDLIELLESDHEYKSFLLDGQTSVLDDYLEVRPERRDTIKRLVSTGRLYIGPWYVLPDSFLVSGEALIRNLLKGTRAAGEYGADRFVGYIPDSFGHTGQLPQIFRGFGMDTAVFWRGFGGEPGQEGSEYRWTGPDGSWVLAEHLTKEGYSGAYFDSDDPADILKTFEGARERVDRRTDASARLMLSGGDHHWPTPGLPNALKVISKELGQDASVIHSNLIEYFDELKRDVDIDDIPEIVGEQRFGYRWAYNVTGGVYSARMHLKQANAECQRLLEGYLERLNAVAMSNGMKSQSPLIRQAWTTLLQNHPHDSICGCSIDSVHREMVTRFEKVENAGKAIERFLWQELTDDEEGVHADDREIIVFNPSPFERTDIVECDVEFFLQEVAVGGGKEDFVPDPAKPHREWIKIENQDGSRAPFEVLDRDDAFGISYNRFGYPTQSRVDRFRLRFRADRVPALGFSKFTLSEAGREEAAATSDIHSTDQAVENEWIRLGVDSDGAFWVESKLSGETFGPLGILEDSADAGDEYNYSPPENDETYRSDRVSDVSIQRLSGQLKAGVVVSSSLRIPAGLNDELASRSDELVEIPFRTTAWLEAGAPFVSFETELENRARDHRLRVLFETGCETNTHYAESAFAVSEREQRSFEGEAFAIEVPTPVAPAQRFILIEKEGRGAAVLTDGLPEYELVHDSEGTLALTLLRCVGELSRGGLKMRPGGRAGWYNPTPEAQCLGPHRFRYGFFPYEAPWYRNYRSIERVAISFLEPLRTRVTKRADPPIPESGLVSLKADGVVVSAIKEAEDGNDIVIRAYNPTTRSIEGEITFGVPPKVVSRARMDERPIEDLALSSRHGVAETWQAYEIKTFRIRF